MSRAYRITVKESDTRHLKAGDEIATQLEILEILPPEDMATLLREELKKRGFEEQDDGTLVRKDGEVTVTVDPCSGEVSVKADAAAVMAAAASGACFRWAASVQTTGNTWGSAKKSSPRHATCSSRSSATWWAPSRR